VENFFFLVDDIVASELLRRKNLPWFLPLDVGQDVLEVVVMGSLMLICAVAASLAFGVLVAYGVCLAMFRIFRVHATAVAKERVASVQMAIEG